MRERIKDILLESIQVKEEILQFRINNDMIYGRKVEKYLSRYYILCSMGGIGVLSDQVFNEKGDLLMGADFTTPWI